MKKPRKIFLHFLGHFEASHKGKPVKFSKKVIAGNDGLEELFADVDGDDKLYNCSHCDYITHMADLCGLHMEKEHNDSSALVYVNCDKCKYVSKSRGNLINHKRLVHENYKPKKCNLCDKRFASKALLDEHMARSHNPEGILCPDCGKTFTSPKLLKRHELWHHKPDEAGGPVPCDICGKISMHRFALQKHIQRVHKRKEKRLLLGLDSSDKIACHVCGKMYSDRRSLKSHLSKQHPEVDY